MMHDTESGRMIEVLTSMARENTELRAELEERLRQLSKAIETIEYLKNRVAELEDKR